MDSRTLKNLDWVLLLLIPALIAAGLAAIFSAAGGQARAAGLVQKQLAVAIAGIAVLAVTASLDDHLLPRLSRPIYWVMVALLLFVDIFGRSAKGAQRWIDLGFIDLQPSEPAKVALIITLSVFFVTHYDEILELRTVLRSLAHLGLPLLLIFKQPDLGTSLVLGTIWVGIAVAAGVQWKHVAGVIVCALAAAVVAWNAGILKDYQKQRLTSFLNPDADPQRTGYHILQSRIAIGSGQMTGQGYLRGSQSRGDFIPEQHTDFIFTVVGEETGFVGSAMLVALYWLLAARVVLAMQSTEERLGRMLAGGVLAMLLFHTFVNVGMTLGLMPVTGVPLPLFSYGPSNLLSTLAALGLVIGAYARRHRIAF